MHTQGTDGASRVALAAAILLMIGTSLVRELMLPLGLPIALVAFAVAWRAAGQAHRGDGAAAHLISDRLLHAGLSAMAATALLIEPGFQGGYGILFRAVGGVGILLVGVHGGGDERWRRASLGVLLALALVVPLAAPAFAPVPRIDVYTWSQLCAQSFLHGIHPYTVQAPDAYQGAANFGYVTVVYPYPPGDVLFTAVGVALFGDYRYQLGLCRAAVVLLLWRSGRRRGVDPGRLDLILLAYAMHPRAGLMVLLGWKEPLLELLLATFLLLRSRRRHGPAQAVAFFLVPSVKQYFLAPIALYLGDRPRPRDVALGLLAAAATVVPFLIWNREATLFGTLFTLRGPMTFRDDSLSVTALLAALWELRPPRISGVIAEFAVAAPAWLLVRRRGDGGLFLASGLSMFAAFLFGSQAFMNYYALVAMLLLCAALALAGRQPE